MENFVVFGGFVVSHLYDDTKNVITIFLNTPYDEDSWSVLKVVATGKIATVLIGRIRNDGHNKIAVSGKAITKNKKTFFRIKRLLGTEKIRRR